MCNGDSDYKKGVNNMEPEVYSEIYNNPDIIVKTETSDSTSDNLMQSDQSQIAMDEVLIKHEVDSDSDIEVDLAYRIIDTFNVGDVKTFKREGEQISSYTETSMKLEFQNYHKHTQSKVEMDYETANDLKVSDKKEIVIIKGNVDCENSTSKDDMKKTTAHQLQSKGM